MPDRIGDPSEKIQRLKATARRVASELPALPFVMDFPQELAASEKELDSSTFLQACQKHIRSDRENLGHGLFHAVSVARDAGALMRVEAHRSGRTPEQTDRLAFLVQVAALLHDVRRKEKSHALAGAVEVEKILKPTGLPEAERARIVTAVRNHEAFKPTEDPADEDGQLISDVLYDADKFRWGPDNFTHTVWQMMESSGGPSLDGLHRRFLQNLDYIRRVKSTFRSDTGKVYGPAFVDRGIEIGKVIYRELSRMLGGPRMELFTDLEQVKGCCSKPGVVTLGNFDGLHIGHQVLIRNVVERAREIGGTSIVFTFHPHPLKVLSPKTCPPLISSYEEKIALFEEMGLDMLLMIPFTREIAEMDAWDFAEKVLSRTLNASEVFVGFNYRFGRNREGSVTRLREFGEKLGFRVREVREVTVDDEVVSSTKIRDLLKAGNVEHAARLLGRPYAITGRVVQGDRRGRTLGFPTANVDPIHEIMPYPGVYAVRVFVDGRQYNGVANAGFRPTFDKRDLCLEVHILDFSGDIYGREITLFLVSKIRAEKRFESLEALKAQIEKDVVEGRRRLATMP